MNLHLETERLFLRPLSESDAPGLFELYNNPEVMRYTGDLPFKNEEAARQFAIDYLTNSEGQYIKYGLGRLAAVRKEDNKFIGWAGFKYHPDSDLIDMGYRLLKPYWYMGYATELAARVVKHGFEDHNMNEVIAHIHEDNVGSQRVAEKINMWVDHKFLWAGKLPARHYIITKDVYLSKTNNG